MQLALRHGVYGGWHGLGQSGETVDEGTGLPTDTGINFSSGETDPSLYYPAPGSELTTIPGTELTPAELATEQAAAQSWLSQYGGGVLSAAQIAAGIAQGVIRATTTPAQRAACPSGAMFPNGQCVGLGGGAAAPLIAGIPNQTLVILGVGFLALLLLGGGKHR